MLFLLPAVISRLVWLILYVCSSRQVEHAFISCSFFELIPCTDPLHISHDYSKDSLGDDSRTNTCGQTPRDFY